MKKHEVILALIITTLIGGSIFWYAFLRNEDSSFNNEKDSLCKKELRLKEYLLNERIGSFYFYKPVAYNFARTYKINENKKDSLDFFEKDRDSDLQNILHGMRELDSIIQNKHQENYIQIDSVVKIVSPVSGISLKDYTLRINEKDICKKLSFTKDLFKKVSSFVHSVEFFVYTYGSSDTQTRIEEDVELEDIK